MITELQPGLQQWGDTEDFEVTTIGLDVQEAVGKTIVGVKCDDHAGRLALKLAGDRPNWPRLLEVKSHGGMVWGDMSHLVGRTIESLHVLPSVVELRFDGGAMRVGFSEHCKAEPLFEVTL